MVRYVQLQKRDAHLEGLVVAGNLAPQIVDFLFLADVFDGIDDFLNADSSVDQVVRIWLYRLFASLQSFLEIFVREGQGLPILLHELAELF